MDIELVPATQRDALTLSNLLQYYVYDLSDLVGAEVGADGCYKLPLLDAYWTDDWRYPYLVRAGGNLTGFALVQHRSRLTGNYQTWDVAEFFVMRKYRRQGVGAFVASRVFDQHRGAWEVRELAANHPAIAFWRRVIGAYTNGRYEESVLDDDRWRGPVQSFRNGDGA